MAWCTSNQISTTLLYLAVGDQAVVVLCSNSLASVRVSSTIFHFEARTTIRPCEQMPALNAL